MAITACLATDASMGILPTACADSTHRRPTISSFVQAGETVRMKKISASFDSRMQNDICVGERKRPKEVPHRIDMQFFPYLFMVPCHADVLKCVTRAARAGLCGSTDMRRWRSFRWLCFGLAALLLPDRAGWVEVRARKLPEGQARHRLWAGRPRLEAGERRPLK